MVNDNPGNGQWKSRLNDLEHLPSVTYDNDAAWDKLHARLRGRKNNKKAFWYWLTAACLVIIFMVPIVIASKKRPKIAGTATVIHPQTKTTAPAAIVTETGSHQKLQIATPEKNVIAEPAKMHGPVHYSLAAITPATVISDHSEQPIIEPVRVADTISLALGPVPEKKKLAVVHINELGDPTIETPDIVRRPDKKYFKMVIGKEEVYADPAVAAKSMGITIFLTKPPTN